MQAFVSLIIRIVVDLFWVKLITFIGDLYARYERRKAAKLEAKKQLQKLKDAKTAEEIDAAIDDALDKL